MTLNPLPLHADETTWSLYYTLKLEAIENLHVLGIRNGSKALDEITSMLEEMYRDRPYHNADHIHLVMSLSAAVAHTLELPQSERACLFLAAMFHDAIYDSKKPDNERQSAKLACRTLNEYGVNEYYLDTIYRLIMLTAQHDPLPEDVTGCILVACDLYILGLSPEHYDTYVAEVRKEYDWVSDENWTVGRAAVLQHLLERETIYQINAHLPTELFHEERARENIKRELAQLVEVASD